MAAAAILSISAWLAHIAYLRAMTRRLPEPDQEVRRLSDALKASSLKSLVRAQTLVWALGATATFIALALLDFDIVFTLMYVAGLAAWFASTAAVQDWHASEARWQRIGKGPTGMSRAWVTGHVLLEWASEACFLAVWAFAAYLVAAPA
jgi:hypothetical protein